MSHLYKSLIRAAAVALALPLLAIGQEAPPASDVYGDRLPAGAIARLGTIRLRHGSSLQAVAFSPDGKTLATAGTDDTIRIWDVATGKEVKGVKGQNRQPMQVYFSPDGKTLLSAGYDGAINLIDVATGKTERTFGAQAKSRIQAAAWSADKKVLATSGADGIVRLWDPATGQEVKQLAGERTPATGLALSPDGKRLAWQGSNPGIRILDVESGKELRKLEAKGSTPFATGRLGAERLAFSPDGKLLVAAGYNSPPTLWDVDAGKQLRNLGDQYNSGMVVAFSPSGKVVAAAGTDRSVRIWGVATGKELRRLEGTAGSAAAIAFSPDGKLLAAVGPDQAVRVWDLEAGADRHGLGGHRGAVNSVVFLRDGQRLVSAGGDGTLRLWDAATGKELERIDTQSYYSSHPLVVAPDGNTVLTVTTSLNIQGWQPGGLREQYRLSLTGLSLSQLTLSPDGQRVAAVSNRPNDTAVHLFDAVSGKELLTLATPQRYVSSLTFSPDGRVLAARGNDYTLRLWDRVTGKVLADFGDPQKPASVTTLLGFSPDSRLLAMGGQEVRIVETLTGLERLRLGSPRGATNVLAFSPDGRLVVQGNSDGTVLARDAATGHEVGTLAGHQGPVRSLAFSRDGKCLASASTDTTLLVWDATRLRRGPAAVKLRAEEVAGLYNDLANADATRAHKALWALVGDPAQAVSFLAERLKPADPVDPKRLSRLIADLDAEEFRVRQKASAELEDLGEAAVPALRKAREGRVSLEMRRRLDELLEKYSGAPTNPEKARGLRVVEVLERMGTPEARKLLEKLAGGADDLVTRDAKAALERLAGS
jgi:WD40 repeat protein